VVDRLGLITRYECPTEGCPCHTPIFGQRHADDCPGPTRVRVDYVPVSQLEGAVQAFEDFIAEVAGPTGRLMASGETEGPRLHAAVKAARSKLTTLRGQ
jgi:hypothetical protein